VSDALGVEALAADGDALAMQVHRHGHVVNTEASGQFVDGGPGEAAVDERKDLMVWKASRGPATDTDRFRHGVSVAIGKPWSLFVHAVPWDKRLADGSSVGVAAGAGWAWCFCRQVDQPSTGREVTRPPSDRSRRGG
jgi:hypothetical protein